MSKKNKEITNEERAELISSTMIAFDETVKDAVKAYAEFFIENMPNAESLIGDEDAQALIEQYVTNRANKIAEHTDNPGGIPIDTRTQLGDVKVDNVVPCKEEECCCDCHCERAAMPDNIFDMNVCITIANVYRMSGRPALICGKEDIGYTVITDGLTYEEIMKSSSKDAFDYVLYTDGRRITTIVCPDSYEKYYLL